MFINRGRFQYLFNLPCSLELARARLVASRTRNGKAYQQKNFENQFISRRKEILTMLLFAPLQPKAMAFIFPMKDFCSSKDHETFN